MLPGLFFFFQFGQRGETDRTLSFPFFLLRPWPHCRIFFFERTWWGELLSFFFFPPLKHNKTTRSLRLPFPLFLDDRFFGNRGEETSPFFLSPVYREEVRASPLFFFPACGQRVGPAFLGSLRGSFFPSFFSFFFLTEDHVFFFLLL